jgi:hypothetical protein
MKSIKRVFSIIISTFLFLLFGRILFLLLCILSHNYGDRVWQPYQEGDSLIYYNNHGDTVKLIISQIQKKSFPSEQLLPFSHWKYRTMVDIAPQNHTIVDIITELGKKRVYLSPPFSRNNIFIGEEETSLETFQYNQMDVIKIERYEKDWHDPYVKTIFWSSQFGYIKVFYSDGETLELQSFTRNGKCKYELK